ncbi:MAG TPA: hypothetical protein DER60_03860 [Syntrophomonas sp.]|nr:hypothetical protein [Syntrophomonas sp.]
MLEAIESGLVMGSIYALLALAINIIYSTTGIINFAHAELVMLGAMFSLAIIVNSGAPIIPGLIIACALVGVVALVLYYATIKPFGDRLGNSLGWLMTTLGAGIIFKNIAQLIWGTQPRAFPSIGGESLKTVLGIKILPHDLWVLVITLAIALFIMALFDKTVLGSAIRATAHSHNTTRLMGISAEKIILVCFLMSGIVAGIAGNLIAPITFAGAQMTSTIGLKGFGAAIIGGIGNSKGAFVGGLLLGILEAVSMLYVTPGYKDAIAFFIMIAVISIKPGGIFGVAYETKV